MFSSAWDKNSPIIISDDTIPEISQDKMEAGSQEFIQMVVEDLEGHFGDEANIISMGHHTLTTGRNRGTNTMLSGNQSLSRNNGRAIVFAQGHIAHMEDDDIVDNDGTKDSDNESQSVDEFEGNEVIADGSISDCDQVNVLSTGNGLSRGMLVTSSHLEQPGYIAMKPGANQVQCVGLGDIVYGSNTMGHIILQESVENEMIVEENVEVGGEENLSPDGVVDMTHDEIILVPNSMLKQEIMETGEVIVGSNLHPQNVGNEIVISDHVGVSRHAHSHHISLAEMDDDGTFDSNLVIDTESIKEEGVCVSPSVGYDCGECGAVLKSRGALKKHIGKYHSPPEPEMLDVPNRIYNCVSCHYQTARRDKLDKHLAKHIAEGFSPSGKKRSKTTPPQRMRHEAEEYKCQLCLYRCTVEKAWKKHMKLHQAGSKHFVVKVSCKICGKDRSSETDLRKHMKRHKSDKDFLCDICGFASVQLKKIIQHRRMHTGEKPHLCPHCSYRSARRDNLRSHVRRLHKKENMFIDTFNPRADITVE